MTFTTLTLEVDDGVALITLSRPEKLNALNRALVADLGRAVDRVAADPAVRVVIITGAGPRAFMAGADIAEFRGMRPMAAVRFTQEVQAVFDRIERMPKPVIAAVNGLALGGGCELSLACDLVVASEAATFGQPEINLGLIPGAGGTQRLTRLVGRRRAKQMVLTGEPVGAPEALRLGLANAVVPAEELMPAARALAGQLKAKGALALEFAKAMVDAGADIGLDRATALERQAFALLFDTADQAEGTAAFLEKRPARFTGR
jgi:enoyl-CoA hydratase